MSSPRDVQKLRAWEPTTASLSHFSLSLRRLTVGLYRNDSTQRLALHLWSVQYFHAPVAWSPVELELADEVGEGVALRDRAAGVEIIGEISGLEEQAPDPAATGRWGVPHYKVYNWGSLERNEQALHSREDPGPCLQRWKGGCAGLQYFSGWDRVARLRIGSLGQRRCLAVYCQEVTHLRITPSWRQCHLELDRVGSEEVFLRDSAAGIEIHAGRVTAEEEPYLWI